MTELEGKIGALLDAMGAMGELTRDILDDSLFIVSRETGRPIMTEEIAKDLELLIHAIQYTIERSGIPWGRKFGDAHLEMFVVDLAKIYEEATGKRAAAWFNHDLQAEFSEFVLFFACCTKELGVSSRKETALGKFVQRALLKRIS
jgi:hypothetical protein